MLFTSPVSGDVVTDRSIYSFATVCVVENTNVSGCSDMWARISSSILLICTTVFTI